MKEYITIEGNSTAEYDEKHSRFIATAFFCDSEESATNIITAQKSKYWDARHNVYAYVLQNGSMRFSDDGEPHGTAGMPMLDVIKGSGVTNVLVVVTRYFGGILLGTGGLVRAYSTATRDALNQAQKVLMCACTQFSVTTEYTNHSRLLRLIEDEGGMLIDTIFTDKVELIFRFKDTDKKEFLNKLNEAFAAKLEAKIQQNSFFPFKI